MGGPTREETANLPDQRTADRSDYSADRACTFLLVIPGQLALRGNIGQRNPDNGAGLLQTRRHLHHILHCDNGSTLHINGH